MSTVLILYAFVAPIEIISRSVCERTVGTHVAEMDGVHICGELFNMWNFNRKALHCSNTCLQLHCSKKLSFVSAWSREMSFHHPVMVLNLGQKGWFYPYVSFVTRIFSRVE